MLCNVACYTKGSLLMDGASVESNQAQWSNISKTDWTGARYVLVCTGIYFSILPIGVKTSPYLAPVLSVLLMKLITSYDQADRSLKHSMHQQNRLDRG